MNKKLFSIIIPTMQKNIKVLNKLVNILCNEKCVGEVIIIDNSLKGYSYKSEKVKIIVPKKNLYVNPSWNLGIKKAKYDYFGILNDDLLIPQDLCSKVLGFICNQKKVGLVGLDSDIILPTPEEEFNILPNDAKDIIFETMEKTIYTEFWGTAFFGHKNNYIQIPNKMKIWCGDNFLLKKNKDKGNTNYQIKNIEIKHLNSLTSASKKFDKIKIKDVLYYSKIDSSVKVYEQYKQATRPLYKNIFELINSEDGKHKIITLLGIKISIKIDYSKYVKKIKNTNKKTCLYIDSEFLHPDTNCGDRASFGYISLLKQMDIDVYFMPIGIHNVTKKNLERFNELGINVIKTSNNKTNLTLIKSWLKLNGKHLDYVFINRPDVWNKVYEYINKYAPQAKLIYQGHDIHFLRLQRQQESENIYLQGNITRYKNLEHNIWNISDVILYFSKVETEIVKKYNPNAKVYDVPLYTSSVFKGYEYNAKLRKNLIFVGGFNHAPNVDGVLWFANKVYPDIQKKNKDIKFYIVGSNPPESILKLANNNIVVTGYISDDQLNKLYNEVRIVVAPLLYGAGIKGKIIEALQQNIPVFTTTIGAEGIYDTNQVITIADTEEEWINQLSDLYSDFDKLNKISSEAKLVINDNFSEDKAKKCLVNILKKEY